MNIYDAAQCLADNMAEVLGYEYFNDLRAAVIVAKAMSVATGKCWSVASDKRPNAWWIVPSNVLGFK